jgi:hypothetical protein
MRFGMLPICFAVLSILLSRGSDIISGNYRRQLNLDKEIFHFEKTIGKVTKATEYKGVLANDFLVFV